MKRKIKVFPDFFATPFWDYDTGMMLDIDEIGNDIIPDVIVEQLEHWVCRWEDHADDWGVVRMSDPEQFHQEGRDIVNLLNEIQNEIEFIYCQYDPYTGEENDD